MEIRIAKKHQDDQPSLDHPGEQLWYGNTDPGGDSSLPASILASVIDVGLWYRLPDFREKWDSFKTTIEGGEVTEVSVRLLLPETNYDTSGRSKPKFASIRVRSGNAAVLAISELLKFIELLEADLSPLWIRVD